MSLNRRPDQSFARAMVELATALLLGMLAAPIAVHAQDPPFPTPLPQCYVQPSPDNDTWPKAVTDSLGTTPGVPVTFAGATLLANDTGTSLAVLSVGPASSGGGTIAGTDPYTFTPVPGFAGADLFPYEIRDAAAQTTVGIVRISVSGDVVAPSVAISQPLGGNVSGSVTVRASASDNAGVSSVTFFDGAFEIGSDGNAPFEAAWNTTLVANGNHSLSAVARDAAGNTATSAVVTVNVLNTVTVAVPNVVGKTQPVAQGLITGAGLVVGAVTSANSPTVAIGNIISQSPAAGVNVASGSNVAFVLALGARVPNIVGSTQSAATAAITTAGLTVGTITTATSSTAAGTVLSQSLQANTNVAPGTAMALVVSSGPAPPPVGGLVLALGFEETSGNPVVDSSPAPMSGTISGATRVAAGRIGRALLFDGVNDWVTVTDTTGSKLDPTTGMTVEAWVNPTAASGWTTVVMKERGSAGEGLLAYGLYGRDGAPRSGGTVGPAGYLRTNPVATTTDRGARGTAAIPLNTWTHLATTYDGTSLRVYVNGVLAGTTAGSGSINVANGALRIGGNNSAPLGQGEFYKGLIDEVRIYNRALSASEIAADMATPVVR